MRPQEQKHRYTPMALLAVALTAGGVAKAETTHSVMLSAFPLDVNSQAATVADRRCIMSATCFARVNSVRGLGESRVESYSYRTNLEIGDYGPVQFKFYGDRVKMKWRF